MTEIGTNGSNTPVVSNVDTEDYAGNSSVTQQFWIGIAVSFFGAFMTIISSATYNDSMAAFGSILLAVGSLITLYSFIKALTNIASLLDSINKKTK